MSARPQKGRLVFVVELRGRTGHWRISHVKAAFTSAQKTAAENKRRGWRHGVPVTDARVRRARLIMERSR